MPENRFTLSPEVSLTSMVRLPPELRPQISQALDPERRRMLEWDLEWAANARWIDARICLSGDVKPYDASCGGTPICEWGFYDVDVPCNASSFGSVLFQSSRYTWAQRQLMNQLASRPGPQTPENALAWVYWTRTTMRLISMARWSTNITSEYLDEGPATQNALDQILAGAPNAQKLEPGDQVLAKNRHLLSLWMPRDLNKVVYPGGAPNIPMEIHGFDPMPLYHLGTLTTILGRRPTHMRAAWPWRFADPSGVATAASATATLPQSGLLRQMYAWFRATLGTGFWKTDPRAPIRYRTTEGCELGPARHLGCNRDVRAPFAWGGADATIALTVAMATDIINTSFGRRVSRGLTAFLAKYQTIPADLRFLSDDRIGEMRDTLTAARSDEVFAEFSTMAALVGAVAAAAAPVAAVVVAVFVAIVGLLLEILKAANALAYGGAELAAACITGPLVRMIPVDGGAESACEFDIRDQAVAADSLQRLLAVQAAAAAEVPVVAWHSASQRASQGNVSDVVTPPVMRRKPPVKLSTVLLIGGGIVGGAFLLRALRDRQ